MPSDLPTRGGFFANRPIPIIVEATVGCFVFCACVAAAIWLVSHFIDGPQAAGFVIGNVPLAGVIIAFAFRKIELNVFLIGLFVFGLIVNIQPIIAGVVWLICGMKQCWQYW